MQVTIGQIDSRPVEASMLRSILLISSRDEWRREKLSFQKRERKRERDKNVGIT